MIRQRDPSIEGTEAAKLKDRLTRSDVTGLWRINLIGGDRWAYWYTKSPPGSGGIAQVMVLMGGNGRIEQTPVPASRVVIRAPQSEFAETAVKQLWESPGSDRWERRVAEVYDTLVLLETR